MSVMSGTFPDTYGVFYMTVNHWRVRGPSCHRHVYRHRVNRIGKPLSRCHDGDDAHDADILAHSRQGGTSLLRRLSYCFNLTRRTRRTEKGARTYAIFEATSGVGFV